VRHSKSGRSTSESGQYLPKSNVRVRSALPLTTDSEQTSRHVGLGPKGDMSRCSKEYDYSITLSARATRSAGAS
jgi:hypothetical protein